MYFAEWAPYVFVLYYEGPKFFQYLLHLVIMATTNVQVLQKILQLSDFIQLRYNQTVLNVVKERGSLKFF